MSDTIDWNVKIGLAAAVGAVTGGTAVAAEDDGRYMIEEITVTANKQGNVASRIWQQVCRPSAKKS